MSLRKMSAIVPDVLAEITRLIDSKQREKHASARESVRESVQACNACDPLAENQPIDPRKRVGRASEQLELGLTTTK